MSFIDRLKLSINQMSNKYNDLVLEDLNQFIVENNIDLDAVYFSEDEKTYFDYVDADNEITFQEEGEIKSSTTNYRAIRFFPERYKEAFNLLRRHFEIRQTNDYQFDVIHLD